MITIFWFRFLITITVERIISLRMSWLAYHVASPGVDFQFLGKYQQFPAFPCEVKYSLSFFLLKF